MSPMIIRTLFIVTTVALTAVASGTHADARVPLGLPPLSAPADNPVTLTKVELGKKLFFDKRLSQDGTISCSSCHDQAKAFTDGQRLARGLGGRIGTRNAPSLFNAAYSSSLFWDGRRPTLEQQALDPLVNPREHGLSDTSAVVAVIRKDPDYVALFRQAFAVGPERINPARIGQAVASFERTLLSGDSPFDRYQYGGQKDALTANARDGLALFVGRARCASCHTIEKSYALFSDNDFHSDNVGIQKIAPRLAELTTRLVEARKAGTSLDQTVLDQADLAELGRFAVTLRPSDIGKFRTPSLRNVALTAPYMHDGSISNLQDAVDMELYQRGEQNGRPIILTPMERQHVIEFLQSLSGY